MTTNTECSVEGCSSTNLRARGLCVAHYERMRRHGSTDMPTRAPRPERLCEVEGCERRHYAVGLCESHYRTLAYVNPNPCSVEGCERPRAVHGLCGMHYKRVLAYGTTDLPPRLPRPVVPCAVDECERPRASRGLCKMHYNRDRRRRIREASA